MKSVDLFSVMYNNGEPNGTFYVTWSVFLIITLLLQIKVYQKAGMPWYAAVIPFYSAYKMQQMALGKDKGWTFLIFLIPIVGGIFGLYSMYKLFQAFELPGWFGIVSILLPPVLLIAYAYIGFSDSVRYVGPRVN